MHGLVCESSQARTLKLARRHRCRPNTTLWIFLTISHKSQTHPATHSGAIKQIDHIRCTRLNWFMDSRDGAGSGPQRLMIKDDNGDNHDVHPEGHHQSKIYGRCACRTLVTHVNKSFLLHCGRLLITLTSFTRIVYSWTNEYFFIKHFCK